jgi:prepilin-type N-terminal cleavage/methylation domain-containing protein
MNPKRAFTVVELLVVIVIIGILATLITAAVAGAQRSARRARIAMEMSQITTALEHYKNEFGEYPPDLFDDEALVRHVKKRFPRFNVKGIDTSNQASNIRKAIDNVYQNKTVYPDGWHGKGTSVGINLKTEASAITSLSLWLGGFVQKNGKMAGFDADPEAPFGKRQDGSVNDGEASGYTDVSIGTPDKKTFLELEIGKNITFPVTVLRPSAFPCLASKLHSDTFVPILYFRGRSGGGTDAYSGVHSGTAKLDSYNFAVLQDNFGTASAYAKAGTAVSNDNEWVEAEKYQLIHPGLDGKFGPISGSSEVNDDSYFRSLEDLSQADLDNITNFSDFKEIQSMLP